MVELKVFAADFDGQHFLICEGWRKAALPVQMVLFFECAEVFHYQTIDGNDKKVTTPGVSPVCQR
jgi:hypothetical protein